jgi:hypothetical protein
MTGQGTSGRNGVRLCPPPSKDFDPFTATEEDLKRHGLPLRPDPQTQPDMAALWERKARRYRDFEHLEPQFEPAGATRTSVITAAPPPGSFALSPYESCGYELDTSSSEPFTALFVTWTVPDLQYTSNPPVGPDPNLFRTFATLGSVQGGLDVHVEMTVSSANIVTSHLWAEFVGNVNLPVNPGDVISGSLCLDPQTGRANYFFANETKGQTMSFTVGTGLRTATFILAGVSRNGNWERPPLPALARFGVVYFDEISAYTTSGPRSLTSGAAVTMTDLNGNAIATPEKLTDWTFKAVRERRS